MIGYINGHGSLNGAIDGGKLSGKLSPSSGGGTPVDQAEIIITRDGREITAAATQDAGVVEAGTKTATTMIPDEYIIPSGSETVTTNGAYTVTTLTGLTVAVPDPDVDELNITPTELPQSFVASVMGVYGFDEVVVDAIPSTYVGSAITVHTALTASENVIKALAGYYASDTTYTVPNAYITPTTFSRTKGTTYRVTFTKNVDSAGYVTPRALGTYMDLTLETSTVTPTTSTQTVTPTGLGYYLDKVVIDPIPSEYIVPSGVYTATSNTTSADVTGYKYLDVAVPATTPNLTNLTITPTETTTTYTHSGYDGYDAVTVNGISPTYVGSGVDRRSTLSVSGKTVTAQSGYYANVIAATVASATISTGTFSKSKDTTYRMTYSKSVTSAGYVETGDLGGYVDLNLETPSVTPSETTQTVQPSGMNFYLNKVTVNPIPSQYVVPAGTYTATTNASSVDIGQYKYLDVSVSGGTPSLTNLTVTPSATTATYTHSGYDGYGQVTVNAMPSGTMNTGSWTSVKNASQISYDFVRSITSAGYFPTQSIGSSKVLTLQNETVTPSATAQTIQPTDTNHYLNKVTVNAIPSQYIVPSGTYTASANTSSADITNYKYLDVSVSGGGKNAQIAYGFNRVAGTAYTAVTGQSITVSKTGTYHVYWSGWRSSTSGTNGTQLYIGNTAYGTANTSFDSTYTNIQDIHLTNVSLTQGQTITVRARSRGNSYYMYVFNLTIIEA
jgi:hypothetical protein